MSTFRIHEDQENRPNPQLRLKQSNMAPVLQNRSVLGSLGNHLNVQNLPKGKQPLAVLNAKVHKDLTKPALQKPPPPVVPVAQFEAFKVYEDSKENEPLQKAKITEEGHLIKKEWYIKENVVKQEEVKKENREDLPVSCDNDFDDVIPGTPLKEKSHMSVDKSARDELDDILRMCSSKIHSPKDLFFENEEYRSEIYSYLRQHELHNRPKPGYMRKQPDITYSMRSILIDWLVEVVQEYDLQSETLYLAINYIDRFLSYMSVVRGKLQLVGTAAMFIASKYEDIRPPDVNEFVYITDDTYTKKQVLRMEHLILKVLSFDLSVPTPLTFITAISVATDMPDKIMYLAMYLSELSMLEADLYLETLPSVLAASAIAVARYTCKLQPWTEDLKRKTGYEVRDLKKTMEFLYLLFSKARSNPQQAIQEKYSTEKYMSVSKLTPKPEDMTSGN